MSRKPLSLLALLAVLAVSAWGCARTTEAGTYTWATGKLAFMAPNTISQCQSATLAAFNDLGIKVTTQDTSRLSGRIKGITDIGEKVTVDIEPRGEENTQIEIRIGIFGDRGKSEKIADNIRRHL